MIDLTTLLIFIGFMLTGAVFIGYPIGLVIGKRRTEAEFLIDDELTTYEPSDESILESEEIS